MLNIVPENSLVISEANNGFIVNVKGSKEEQEDRMDGVHVFEDISGLTEFIETHYRREKE